MSDTLTATAAPAEKKNRSKFVTRFREAASALDKNYAGTVWRGIAGLVWSRQNAEELSFGDRSFDAYTIAFGIRNVPRIEVALSEAWRVLKRGGRFLCLEFSAVDIPGLDRLYKEWSDRAIPPIGRAVTGDAQPYQYLIESIRKFPPPGRFAAMIERAGFKRVTHTAMSGNIAALHAAWKL